MNAPSERATTLRIRRLVLQPTPFCNIDCRYCYLQNRRDLRRMSPVILRATCRGVFDSPFAGPDLEVIWHAGEPLVLPIEYYETAFAIVAGEAGPGRRIAHSIQLNGLLLDDAWCDFFLRENVRLGLSLDGPEAIHDRNRVTRSGAGTHARALQAARTLKRRHVPFSIIAVLTRASLLVPDAMYAFFEELGALSVGFNLEETEAGHRSEAMGDPDILDLYERFMRRMVALGGTGTLVIRELDAMRVLLSRPAREPRSAEATPLEILSVDYMGNVSTFSPELLGVLLPGYGPFVFGNVATDALADIVATERFRSVASDVARGVSLCRESCDYFEVCGGGAPGNKFFENGSFASAETLHCASKIRVNAEIVLDAIESDAARLSRMPLLHAKSQSLPEVSSCPPGVAAPVSQSPAVAGDPYRGHGAVGLITE